MTRFTLLTVLTAAVLLAGCALPADLQTEAADAVERLSDDQARALLEAASSALPDRFGYTLEGFAPNDTRLVTVTGLRDNATGEVYAAMGGSEALFGAGGGAAGGAAMARFAPLLAQGVELYGSPGGALYLLNGTAVVFPPGQTALGGQIPNPASAMEDTPYSPQMLVGLLQQAGLNITSVGPTTYEGALAWRVEFEAPRDAVAVRGHAIVTAADQRLAQMGLVNPDPASPVERVVVDLRYGADAGEVPAPVRAALRIGYSSDANPFGSLFGQQENTTTTWTFLASSPVALDALEVVAKGSAKGASPLDLRAQPTLWTMPLADGERAEGNVTVAFTDADGDGRLSAGDRVTVRTTGGAAVPRLAMRDAGADVHALAPADLIQAFLGA